MNTLTELLNRTGWETPSTELMFSPDQVIDAYNTGKSEGIEEAPKMLSLKIIENIGKTAQNSFKVLEIMRSMGFLPLSVYLRIDSVENYSLLILISEEQYTGGSILELYDRIMELELEFSDKSYNLNISLCDGGDEINEIQIGMDGFLCKLKDL